MDHQQSAWAVKAVKGDAKLTERRSEGAERASLTALILFYEQLSIFS